MPKFGVSLYSLYQKFESKEMTPDDGVRWLVEVAGVDIMEISAVGFSLIETPELIGRIKSAAGHVPITNYTVGANFLQPTQAEYEAEMQTAKKHVDIGHELGASLIRFDSVPWSRPKDTMNIESFLQDLPRIIDGYQQICEYAAQYGITILNENHGMYVNGADRIRALMTGVKSDNFGHLLDVGNYACVDDIAEAACKTVMPFVKHVHVKDFYIRPPHSDPGAGFWFTTAYGSRLRGAVVGQGDINLPAVFAEIVKSGYQGNITLEFEGMEDCLWGVKEGLSNTRRLYAAAKTARQCASGA
jgi:sugar phosphate isomerase/epimerase